MSPVLDLRNLSVDLPLGGFLSRARLPILKDVTLSVARGESVALVGESGSGKTTLARAVMGLQAVSGGEIALDGQLVEGRRGHARLRRDTAMMFQDATASLSPRLTVGYLVTEPFRIHGVDLLWIKESVGVLLIDPGVDEQPEQFRVNVGIPAHGGHDAQGFA